MQSDALDTKLTQAFGGKVVRKDLLHQIKGGENVPSYVLEYLLGKYCASDDEDEIRIGIEAVKETPLVSFPLLRRTTTTSSLARVGQGSRTPSVRCHRTAS